MSTYAQSTVVGERQVLRRGSCLFFFSIFIYLFICLRQVLVATHGILVAACGIFSCSMQALSCGMRDLVPDQGSNLGPLHWEHGVLTTGRPGKSQEGVLVFKKLIQTFIKLSTCAGQFARHLKVSTDSPSSKKL